MSVKEVYPDACLEVDWTNGSPIYSIWTNNELGNRGLIGLGKTEEEAWADSEKTIKRGV